MHPFYYLTLIAWYAWPIGALAAWALWSESRDGWRTAAVQTPVVAVIGMTLLLSVAHDRRDIYMLPVFVPLALLAERGLVRLPPAFLRRWKLASGGAFVVALAALWIGWLIEVAGWLPSLAARINATQAGFTPEFHAGLMALGIAITLAFVVVMRRPSISGSDAAVQWTAGMTAIYGVAMTLWLPMANYAMSYRPTVSSLLAVLPADARCLNSQSLGEPQRAFLHYLGGIRTRRLEAGHALDCGWILIQGRYDGRDGFPRAPGPDWQPVWESRRGGREVFILYRNTSPDGANSLNELRRSKRADDPGRGTHADTVGIV